jgi:hypothetical protein
VKWTAAGHHYFFVAVRQMSAIEYEWGAAFEVSDYDECFWVAQKVDGVYADPTMILSVVPMAALENVDEAVQAAENLSASLVTCPAVSDVDVLRPSAAGSCW